MNDFLMHYGVKGQKYGVRRYQNEDGTLTPEGREHYGIGDEDTRTKSSGTKEETRDHEHKFPGTKDENPNINYDQVRSNLKNNYRNAMWSNVARFLWGKVGSKVGTAMQLTARSPHMKTAGAIIGLSGKVVMGSAVFRSAAQTGAYFIAKGGINAYEEQERQKKLYG